MKRKPTTPHILLRLHLSPLVFAASLAASTCMSSPAFSLAMSVGQNQQKVLPKTKMEVRPKSGDTKKEPVTLSASQVDYDHEKSLVSASGNVEIQQGDTIMLADYVTYDQVNNIVMASGNVSVLEAGGNVIFAQQMELKDDMKAGLIDQFKARLSDDSLFVAAQGKKYNEDVTELRKAVRQTKN